MARPGLCVARLATASVALAAVRSRGWEPRSPIGTPLYDLAWHVGACCWVAEVKSRQRLGAADRTVHAVLMIEREPRDADWLALCREINVQLLSPELLTTLTDDPLSDAT